MKKVTTNPEIIVLKNTNHPEVQGKQKQWKGGVVNKGRSAPPDNALVTIASLLNQINSQNALVLFLSASSIIYLRLVFCVHIVAVESDIHSNNCAIIFFNTTFLLSK